MEASITQNSDFDIVKFENELCAVTENLLLLCCEAFKP